MSTPDSALLPALTAHHLLAVATHAAAERDRGRLRAFACEKAAAALSAPWAAFGHIDEDGRLVVSGGTGRPPLGTVVADAAAVAHAGLTSATTPVMVKPTDIRVPLLAVMIDPDRADRGVLVVAWLRGHPERTHLLFLEQLARLLAGALERIRLDDEVALSEQRLAEAQQLARLGSYDWHIPSDTNTWSDELYRIYGHEPGAFNASYERFLAMIHPDDRERIMGVHAKAMQDHQPYRMEERIVRPDGQVRILDSTGKVVLDEHGRPVRMVGICLDVTEQRRAAEALRQSQDRFRALVECAPDAVIVFDAGGLIAHVNRQTELLFGWSADELVGRPVDVLLPDDVRGEMAVGLDLLGRHRRGSTVPVDVSLARITTDDGPATAAFVRDATERRRVAEARRQLAQADERRRQALEINDNVVQGLTAVIGALEMDWREDAAHAARATLASASAMMSELLEGTSDGIVPGDLTREAESPPLRAASASETRVAVPPDGPVRAEEAAEGERPLSVLVADDSSDLRSLYRLMLDRQGIDVVAEAANGPDAVRLALTHRPDVALVDLAMPGMDGLQVTETLKRELPDCRVVMLSGFEESRVCDQARAVGVDRYVGKGIDARALAELLYEVAPPGPHPPLRSPSPPDPVDELLHELRTPLTVIGGVTSMLEARLEQIPAEEVHDLLEAVTRNAEHMAALVRVYAESKEVRAGRLRLLRQRLRLDLLTRDTIADLDALLRSRSVALTADEAAVASVDPLRVRQILINLLTNAVKFSPAGSPITVTVEVRDAQAVVGVADEGPGVPPEHRARLFHAFERLGAAGKGAGLGLYVSRRLAEAHGGSLDLEADEVGRTRFVLRLPMDG